MRRREFTVGLLLAVTVRPTSAQQGEKVYRIAVVHSSTPTAELRSAPHFRAFFDELHKKGYLEGQNLLVDLFSGQGNRERYSELALKVLQRKPDVIFAVGGPLVKHFQSTTSTVPIVAAVGDPVGKGFAASLARPGRNITGVSSEAGFEIWNKRLGLLKEAVPSLSRASLVSSRWWWENPQGTALRKAAQEMGISLVSSLLEENMQDAEYQRVFAAMSQERVHAIVVSTEVENYTHRRLIVQHAEKTKLPAIYPWREAVEIGGLMAYAFDAIELYGYAANQVAQILKGANPGDIPFYQPAKFELVINRTTAKALGITLPPSLLALAGEIIE